jgi:hypothetical protein
MKYCIVNNTVTLFNPKAPSGQDNIFLQNSHAICFLLELDQIEKAWILHRCLTQLNDAINELCTRFFYEAGE